MDKEGLSEAAPQVRVLSRLLRANWLLWVGQAHFSKNASDPLIS